MKQQFLSVLFLALICSTLGHEYLRAHELTHKFKHHSRNHPSIPKFRNNNSCSYVCPVPNTSNEGPSQTRLIINKELSIVAVVNVTANVAFVVDLQENLVLLLNGQTGVAILIDVNGGSGIYFAAGSNDKTWIAANISITEYLWALGSLKNVKDFPNGQPFNLQSASSELVVHISAIISSLGTEIADRLKIDTKAAISIVIVISKTFIATLGGELSIIIKKVDGVEFVLHGGIVRLITVLKGLASFSKTIVGGLEAIIVADIQFKLSLLLAAASGLEVILALLSQVAGKVDLSKILAPLLKSPEAFLEAVVSINQGLYVGISGIESLVYNVLLLVSKKITITAFIDITIQVAASGGGVSQERFSEVIGGFIRLINTQCSTFQSSQSWQIVLTFFTNIQAGKLVVGGIDISAIISAIIEGAGQVSLSIVVAILLKLSAVVGIGVAIANLYLRLVFFIISGQGISFVLKLIPSISLNIDFSSSKSILVQILSGVKVSKVLTFILTLNVVGVITNLPVFGDIFGALAHALEASGNTTDEFKNTLKGSAVISVLFGWIKYGLGIPGGSAASGGITGQVIFGGTASIDTNISISNTVGSSSSSISTSSPATPSSDSIISDDQTSSSTSDSTESSSLPSSLSTSISTENESSSSTIGGSSSSDSSSSSVVTENGSSSSLSTDGSSSYGSSSSAASTANSSPSSSSSAGSSPSSEGSSTPALPDITSSSSSSSTGGISSSTGGSSSSTGGSSSSTAGSSSSTGGSSSSVSGGLSGAAGGGGAVGGGTSIGGGGSSGGATNVGGGGSSGIGGSTGGGHSIGGGGSIAAGGISSGGGAWGASGSSSASGSGSIAGSGSNSGIGGSKWAIHYKHHAGKKNTDEKKRSHGTETHNVKHHTH